MSDLFNNSKNNYVMGATPPCENLSDEFIFEFLPKEYVGIVNGANVPLSMFLGDIQQVVTDYTKEKKLLQSGEITYISGLTKGLIQRTQVFDIPYYFSTIDKYFLMVDLSINHYRNFRFTSLDVDTSSNYTLNLDIDDAINIDFANNGVGLTSYYDSSTMSFQGNSAGWDFDVSNVTVTLIDASLDSSSPIPSIIDASGNRTNQTYVLVEDPSVGCEAAKYLNGAMLGFVLKIEYPVSTTVLCTDEWIYYNHVPNTKTYYESVAVDTSTYYQKFTKTVDVGKNGMGDSSVMSAGDYLDLITNNNEWNKVGQFYSLVNTVDLLNGDENNLVNGFYLYNPHDFDVMVEYILIN
jgi:hypothetical protein